MHFCQEAAADKSGESHSSPTAPLIALYSISGISLPQEPAHTPIFTVSQMALVVGHGDKGHAIGIVKIHDRKGKMVG